jgi:hypothetical protein
LKRGFLGLCLTLPLVAALLRWPSLDLPLDRDEGEYATLAWLWQDGHGLPYRDWLQQKPPAAIGINAVAQSLFSDGVLGLRWVSLLWTAFTVLALGLWMLRMARRQALAGPDAAAAALRAAWLAGLLAAFLLSSSRTQSIGANTEAWLILPLIAALSLAFGGAPSPARWLAAGAFVGVASLFKQPVLAGVLILPWAVRPGAGRLLGAVAWTTAGALLPWALVIALFAPQGGALALLECTWAYNQGYLLQGLDDAWRRAFGLGRWLAPELGAPAFLAVLGWRRLGPGPWRRALGAWLGLSALLLVSGRFYPHYTIGLLAPLAALAALAWTGLLGRGQRALRAGLLLLAAGGWAYSNGALWSAQDGGERSFQVFGISHFAAAPAAAGLIQRSSTPDKPIFIWGDEPQLYYLSRRVPASRFLYSYPFTGEAPPWPDGARQLRASLHSPWVGAVVLAKPLDARDPLQMEILDVFQSRFEPDHSVPPYIIGRPLP